MTSLLHLPFYIVMFVLIEPTMCVCCNIANIRFVSSCVFFDFLVTHTYICIYLPFSIRPQFFYICTMLWRCQRCRCHHLPKTLTWVHVYDSLWNLSHGFININGRFGLILEVLGIPFCKGPKTRFCFVSGHNYR